MTGQRMFRRRYVLAKPTPKLSAGTRIWFDPFQGDYTNEPLSLLAAGKVTERFSFAEVENPEWFTPDSDLAPFRPPMIPADQVTDSYSTDSCVMVSVESRHNDMCDWCRNARAAIARTQSEVLPAVYETLKSYYESDPETS